MKATTPALILKPGREKSLIQRHPWVFSGAVDRVVGEPAAGVTVAVYSAGGEFLAWAGYSPVSQIRARVWSFQKEEEIGPDLFRERLKSALRWREKLISPEETNAMRLVHGESDGLPGLVVDRYADVLVVQILSSGAEYWRRDLVSLLVELTGIETIFERSDVDVRGLEGLPERTGLLSGRNAPERLMIYEEGIRYEVNVQTGQKTGFYLDQRRNRARLKAYAEGREVLNCFCYTGGFTLSALAGGASHVLSIDSSGEALLAGRQNLALNGLPEDRAEWLEGDVFQVLRKFRDQARSFDLIVLDPPKFAPTVAQAERAARGYKDINLLACKLLRPGGVLFTFSCSGGISPALFQKIVAGAAVDAGAEMMVVERLAQGPDHPVSLYFPEGEYLKGLVCVKQ
ncbi:predicted SAM-dependent methyltransferases [Anaerolinea thermolimosa]|uniref:class I SAM-dependent rRNA methyltransferase n=1 Tax=Anaerolinea thermolimosa TaxID=229919 RepID=UPI000785A6A1|nr:class I SAM-dependent methyltransferase [Anaerolinea thermolimosa]GAP05925.1 predicted SAM-dependent methyltransferases [Anaerolinea thermolimosa]